MLVIILFPVSPPSSFHTHPTRLISFKLVGAFCILWQAEHPYCAQWLVHKSFPINSNVNYWFKVQNKEDAVLIYLRSTARFIKPIVMRKYQAGTNRCLRTNYLCRWPLG